jgi:hypothetical protein
MDRSVKARLLAKRNRIMVRNSAEGLRMDQSDGLRLVVKEIIRDS